jgi:hypothetical protein
MLSYLWSATGKLEAFSQTNPSSISSLSSPFSFAYPSSFSYSLNVTVASRNRSQVYETFRITGIDPNTAYLLGTVSPITNQPDAVLTIQDVTDYTSFYPTPPPIELLLDNKSAWPKKLTMRFDNLTSINQINMRSASVDLPPFGPTLIIRA